MGASFRSPHARAYGISSFYSSFIKLPIIDMTILYIKLIILG